MCPCASIRPGNAKASSRSITRVDGPSKSHDIRQAADGDDRAVARGERLGPGMARTPVQIRLTLTNQVGRTILTQTQAPGRGAWHAKPEPT